MFSKGFFYPRFDINSFDSGPHPARLDCSVYFPDYFGQHRGVSVFLPGRMGFDLNITLQGRELFVRFYN